MDSPMTKRLFIYGTLLPGREPAPLRSLLTRMTPIGPASVAGSVYDLGPYPGALLEPSVGRVFGHLFDVPDEDTFWRALDAYEGFDSSQPHAGLFRRVACLAKLDDDGAEFACDVYVYNNSPPQSQRVANGRWQPAETE
jgi:gamma-glutamylcyclotransferase (GGCT)/AIG2-like uncharacterized protein YtfP